MPDEPTAASAPVCEECDISMHRWVLKRLAGWACARCGWSYDDAEEEYTAVLIPTPPPSPEREALMRIVRVSVQVMEGSSGHPVVYQNEACLIASEALRLSRDELLAIGRAVHDM